MGLVRSLSFLAGNGVGGTQNKVALCGAGYPTGRQAYLSLAWTCLTHSWYLPPAQGCLQLPPCTLFCFCVWSQMLTEKPITVSQ